MAPKYDPNAAADAAGAGDSSSSSGPADLWGLGPKAKSPVFTGITTPQWPTGPGAGASPGSPAAAREQTEADQHPGLNGAPTAGSAAAARAQTESDLNPAGQPKFRSALEMMQQLPRLFASNPAGYRALQQRLYMAGYYGATPPRMWGAYDPDTISAYRSAVLAATQFADSETPVSFDEMLAQNAASGGPAQAAKRGFIAQYSDPAAVAGIAQRAAQSSLHRNLTAQEVRAFVNEFHAAEKSWNSNQKTAEVTSAGGQDATTTQAPSAEAAAEAYVQRGAEGAEAGGERLGSYVQVLQQLVGGQ
jgi:hypothetical protein